MKWIFAAFLIIGGLAYGAIYPSPQDSLGVLGGTLTGDYVFLNLNTTSVTSGNYVQISTLAARASWIDVYNGTGSPFLFATGSTGAQAAKGIIFPPGNDRVQIELLSGSSVWIKAASTGEAPSGVLILNYSGVPN